MTEAGAGAGRRVFFRLEFGGSSGWGHLVRSGALAAELGARGWECGLWTASETGALPEELCRPFATRVRWVEGDSPPPCRWLVVDHYGVNDEALAAWRAAHPQLRILVIDDMAQRRCHAAQLVLNSRPGLANSPYAAGVPTLLGERYALLRPGLRTPEQPRWCAPDAAEAVLVLLGGTDPTGAAHDVLEALADAGAGCLAPVLVRPGGQRPPGLERFRHAVYVDTVNAAQLAGWAGRCRFAVSAAGGTLLELAFLRLPFVAVVVADNQLAFAAAVQAGWGQPQVTAGPGLRQALAGAIERLRVGAVPVPGAVDGRGAARVAERLCAEADGR